MQMEFFDTQRLRTRTLYFEIVQSIAGAASGPEVEMVSDPVHGTLVVVTLSRTEEIRDREAERGIRCALDGFTCAYRIAWRNQRSMT